MRLAFAIVFIAASAFGQSSDARLCAIDGSVINSATGLPVLRAYVTVTVADDIANAITDVNGKWLVEHVSCGEAKVIAKRVGYLPDNKGVKVTLSGGIPAHDTKLSLTPQAVIEGRVTDDQGDPVHNVQVGLVTSRISNGKRSFQENIFTATDDRGEYRYAGLTAGKYLVCAGANASFLGDEDGAPQMSRKCYPGPVEAGSAVAMNVAAGSDNRVDFALTPLNTVQVRGTLVGLPAGAAGEVGIRWGNYFLNGMVHKDGAFVFQNIPSGKFFLMARSDAGGRELTARMPISVGAINLEGLQLHLDPGTTIGGTVKINSTTGKKWEPPHFMVALTNSEGNDSQGRDLQGEAFSWSDIAPGDYRLEVSASGPLYVKSVTMGGRDISRAEFAVGPGMASIEVVLSDDGGVVEGDVKADDAPAPGWVLLERDGLAVRNANTDAGGHFRIDNVPPGDYKVYAWDDQEKVEYANPDWMQRNAKAIAVTVQPSQKQIVTIPRQIAPPE